MMVLCESESERWFYVRDRKGEKKYYVWEFTIGLRFYKEVNDIKYYALTNMNIWSLLRNDHMSQIYLSIANIFLQCFNKPKCVYACMCIYMCMCIYVYVCMYIIYTVKVILLFLTASKVKTNINYLG